MEVLRMLIRTAKDDIKDASMLVNYAEKAKLMGRDDVAAMMVARANRRINDDFPSIHKVIQSEIVKAKAQKGDSPESAQGMFWDIMHGEYMEWVSDIKAKIANMR